MNVVIYNSLLCVSAAFALWRGGAPERLVAVSFVLADVLTLVTLPPVTVRFRRIDPAILTIDLALLLLLLAIALRANRYWTLAVCGLHLASVYAYLARVVDPTMPREALRFLLAYGAYLQLAILIGATLRHRRRLSVHGHDASWC